MNLMLFHLNYLVHMMNIFLDDEHTGQFHVEPRTDIIKYFPSKSTDCLTLLFSGKWNRSWKEYICDTNNKIVNYSFGRNVI
jgi:hypothetical protein